MSKIEIVQPNPVTVLPTSKPPALNPSPTAYKVALVATIISSDRQDGVKSSSVKIFKKLRKLKAIAAARKMAADWSNSIKLPSKAVQAIKQVASMGKQRVNSCDRGHGLGSNRKQMR